MTKKTQWRCVCTVKAPPVELEERGILAHRRQRASPDIRNVPEGEQQHNERKMRTERHIYHGCARNLGRNGVLPRS
jgi:hypothetical protein